MELACLASYLAHLTVGLASFKNRPGVEQNDNGEVSPSILWDACKAVMRGKLIARAAYRKKTEWERLKRLQTDLKRLETEHKNTSDNKILAEIKKKKAEINDMAYKLKKQQSLRHVYKIKDPQTNCSI